MTTSISILVTETKETNAKKQDDKFNDFKWSSTLSIELFWLTALTTTAMMEMVEENSYTCERSV